MVIASIQNMHVVYKTYIEGYALYTCYRGMMLVGTSACTLDLAPVLGQAIRLREKEIRWVNMTAATQSTIVHSKF